MVLRPALPDHAARQAYGKREASERHLCGAGGGSTGEVEARGRIGIGGSSACPRSAGADWTIDQLRTPAQCIADRIEALANADETGAGKAWRRPLRLASNCLTRWYKPLANIQGVVDNVHQRPDRSPYTVTLLRLVREMRRLSPELRRRSDPANYFIALPPRRPRPVPTRSSRLCTSGRLDGSREYVGQLV